MLTRRSFATAIVAGASLAACSPTVLAGSSPGPRAGAGRHTSLGPVRQVPAGDLTVAYVEYGPTTGPAVVLLHGWPYDPGSYIDVGPTLARAGFRVLVPYLRGYGPTAFRDPATPRNGQQAAIAADIVAFMDALGIQRAVLAGYDWGGRTANIIAALRPERCSALVAVSGYLVTDRAAQQQPLTPVAELGWWYQYYFATERGERGYRQHTREFNKLIWQRASPTWSFDDATYERTAASFSNPDHVAIVVHNYRWRLGLAPGEPRFDADERRLAEKPPVTVPTITITSDFDGPTIDGAAFRSRYTGPYDHRDFAGIGHDVPQEAPDAFARAVLDASRLR